VIAPSASGWRAIASRACAMARPIAIAENRGFLTHVSLTSATVPL
jgi:hypothetical protein